MGEIDRTAGRVRQCRCRVMIWEANVTPPRGGTVSNQSWLRSQQLGPSNDRPGKPP